MSSLLPPGPEGVARLYILRLTSGGHSFHTTRSGTGEVLSRELGLGLGWVGRLALSPVGAETGVESRKQGLPDSTAERSLNAAAEAGHFN